MGNSGGETDYKQFVAAEAASTKQMAGSKRSGWRGWQADQEGQSIQS